MTPRRAAARCKNIHTSRVWDSGSGPQWSPYARRAATVSRRPTRHNSAKLPALWLASRAAFVFFNRLSAPDAPARARLSGNATRRRAVSRQIGHIWRGGSGSRCAPEAPTAGLVVCRRLEGPAAAREAREEAAAAPWEPETPRGSLAALSAGPVGLPGALVSGARGTASPLRQAVSSRGQAREECHPLPPPATGAGVVKVGEARPCLPSSALATGRHRRPRPPALSGRRLR